MNTGAYLKKLLFENIGTAFLIISSSLIIIISTTNIPYFLGVCFQQISDAGEISYLLPLYMFILYYVLRLVFKLLRNHFAALLGNTVVMKIRMYILNRILKQDVPAGMEAVSSYSVLTYDLGALSEMISWRTFLFIEDLSILAFSIYMIFRISPVMAIIMLISLSILFLISFLYGRQLGSVICRLRDNISSISSIVLDNIINQKIIRSLNAQKYENIKFDSTNKENLKIKLVQNDIGRKYLPSMEALAFFTFLVTIGASSIMVINKSLNIGAVVTFNGYMWLLVAAVSSISSLVLFYINSRESIKRIGKFFTVGSDLSKEECKDLNGHIESLEARDITIRLGGRKILDHINVSFTTGNIITIIGEIGSGKSTFADILSGANRYFEGSLLVNGQDMKTISAESYSKKIGYVTQEPIFFNSTLEDNILLGRSRMSKEEFRQLLSQCRLDDIVQRMAKKEETFISRESNFLSGGEKQRLCIARVLAVEPDVLIIDDAITAIDSVNQEFILTLLKQMKKNKIIIFISNQETVKEISDYVYELSENKLTLQSVRQEAGADAN